MPVEARMEVLGAKEAIKALGKIDKELRKQFTKDAKEVAEPIVSAAKSAYPDEVLSGMSRDWQVNGKPKFPYTKAKAVRGLKVKVDTSRRAENVIRIQQTDPATSIFEVAGRGSSNSSLGTNIRGKRDRVLWPTAERNLAEVSEQMRQLVLRVISRVNDEVR